MTEPLVPSDVDLRDFAFMPLDVVRLRDSGLTAKASGDAFRAAVLLWCASWHQVPAASLPDDEDELANICGYSRARREWAKVSEGALRGWVRCTDGRLYHAAVAGKALEAWIEKLASAIGGAAGNAKRWNVQIDTDGLRRQFAQAVECLRALDPQSRTLRKKAVAVLTMPSLSESGGESPPESPPDSPPDRKGQGQGQGQGLEEQKTSSSSSAEPTAGQQAGPKVDQPAAPKPTVPCPYRDIVVAYHEALPTLPRVRVFDGKLWDGRCKAMRELWGWVLSSRRADESRRATNADEAMGWIRAYFAQAAMNDFVMGRTPRSAQHANWRCDIDFLLTKAGLKQVLEKTEVAA